MVVSNQFPAADPGPIRLAIVGESPGRQEESWRTCPLGHEFAGFQLVRGQPVNRDKCPSCGSAEWQATPKPFVGPSGWMLNDALRRAGLAREQCFVGNVAQTRLSTKECEDLSHPAIVAGLAQLKEDLATFKPNCVLTLGATALRALHPDKKASISDWRGSLYESSGLKCLAAIHPAAILHAGGEEREAGAQPEYLPLLRFDVKKAVAEAAEPGLKLLKRAIIPASSFEEACHWLRVLFNAHTPLGHDIEGTALTGVTDFSFAISPEFAYWFPLRRMDYGKWWSADEEKVILALTKAVLESEAVPKSIFNASYESFVWKWAHGITVRGIVHDPMMSWHELQPELPKRINMAASILTRQPYWGEHDDCKTDADRALYNGTDSCMCLELDEAILPRLTPGQRAHYEFNLSLLPAMGWQMLRGLRFDEAARDELVSSIEAEVLALRGELDALAGIAPPTFAEVRDIVAMKRKAEKCVVWEDLVEAAKPSWRTKA